MERKGNCLVSLKPIKNKIQNWITYEENKPRIPYEQNCEVHHRYRSTHDLDCVLLGGDLRADNIISLWLPLRYCLVEINGYPTLNKYGNINKKIEFIKALNNIDLEKLLPPDNPLVKCLIELFELGQTEANMMLLPEIGINGKRGREPYYDYTPYFLYECFEGGDFSHHFTDDIALKQWIIEECLQPFFSQVNGQYQIDKNHLLDLSGTNNIKDGVPAKGQKIKMIENYVSVLKKRKILLEKREK